MGVDEALDDEYADQEAQVKDFEHLPPQKPQNKCVVCCKAFFCCKTANTVSKEQEMAQFKLASQTAKEAKGQDQQLEVTVASFVEQQPETQPMLQTAETKADEKQTTPIEDTKTEVNEEENAEDEEIDESSSEVEDEEEEEPV